MATPKDITSSLTTWSSRPEGSSPSPAPCRPEQEPIKAPVQTSRDERAWDGFSVFVYALLGVCLVAECVLILMFFWI